ncbi:MAG: hypothetical protein OEV60_12250 [Actinomycetota bacterium]|nr:hypothetical protein [Actinomycetota bacterium]
MAVPDTGSNAHAAVARALGRLDAYSFFTLPGHGWNADFAVIGTTGAFLIAACDLEGVARVDCRRPTVGNTAVPNLRKLRSGLRRFSARLSDASMFAQVMPLVCLTRAIAGPPVEGAGVRFVKVDDLAREISARPGAQSHTRAQAAARVLGVHIAGDQKRHFTVRG